MNNSPNIRPATADDTLSITRCASAAYNKYVERIGQPPAPMVADFPALIERGKVHVMILDHQLVGFAVCYATDECYFLENIAVDPAYQSHGYGVRLLDYVHQQAVGFDTIRLYTNEKMSENLHWYKKRGYTEIDRRVEAGFARVYFEKRL